MVESHFAYSYIAHAQCNTNHYDQQLSYYYSDI